MQDFMLLEFKNSKFMSSSFLIPRKCLHKTSFQHTVPPSPPDTQLIYNLALCFKNYNMNKIQATYYKMVYFHDCFITKEPRKGTTIYNAYNKSSETLIHLNREIILLQCQNTKKRLTFSKHKYLQKIFSYSFNQSS